MSKKSSLGKVVGKITYDKHQAFERPNTLVREISVDQKGTYPLGEKVTVDGNGTAATSAPTVEKGTPGYQ